jgi:hypothetical protein
MNEFNLVWREFFYTMRIRMKKLIMPGEFDEKELRLSRICYDIFLPIGVRQEYDYPWSMPDADLVEKYRRMYSAGIDLGLLSVVRHTVDRDLRLADGYHRAEALAQLGRKTARCRIYRGDTVTLYLLAARENGRCAHGGRGLAFGPAEHTETVHMVTFWLKTRGVTWSDQELADWISVDVGVVSAAQEDLRGAYWGRRSTHQI